MAADQRLQLLFVLVLTCYSIVLARPSHDSKYTHLQQVMGKLVCGDFRFISHCLQDAATNLPKIFSFSIDQLSRWQLSCRYILNRHIACIAGLQGRATRLNTMNSDNTLTILIQYWVMSDRLTLCDSIWPLFQYEWNGKRSWNAVLY